MSYILTVLIKHRHRIKTIYILLFLIILSTIVYIYNDTVVYYYNYFSEHLNFAFKTNAEATSNSISELKSISWTTFSNYISGNTIIFSISTIGLILLYYNNITLGLLLTPLVLIGFSGKISSRFLIFYLPVYALSFAFIFQAIRNILRKKVTNKVLVNSIILIMIVITVTPSTIQSFNYEPQQQIYTSHDILARYLKKLPKDTIVWSWWNYGYFIQYSTGLATFFDGGSQSKIKSQIAAFPLLCDDVVLAQNWIKFFSERGVTGYHILYNMVGNKEKTFSVLEDILRNKKILNEKIKQHKLHIPNSKEFFFPQKNCALYIPTSTLTLFKSIIKNTLHDDEKLTIDLFLKSDCKIDYRAKEVSIGTKTIDYNKIIQNIKTDMSTLYAYPGNIIIDVPGYSFLYLTNNNFLKTLLSKLIIPLPADHNGFKTMIFHPDIGGVWIVE